MSSWAGATPLGPQVVGLEADETRIYAHESKKLVFRARLDSSLATEQNHPSKWNLIQVDAQGKWVRYIGILYFDPRKKVYFRKVELQERQAGVLFFEIVSDQELEPFVVRSRPQLQIDVLARPSVLEILKGIFRKFSGRALASSPSSEGAYPCQKQLSLTWVDRPDEKLKGLLSTQKGNLKTGGVYAAARKTLEVPVRQLAERLWNPALIKNSENTRVQIQEVSSGSPSLRQRKVEVELHPVFFITLKWQELWEFREISAQKNNERIRIHYEKHRVTIAFVTSVAGWKCERSISQKLS